MQNGIELQRIFSDKNGIVNFGILKPGRYTFREIFAPQGYAFDMEERQVIVDDKGLVCVDGCPLPYEFVNMPANALIG